jgi:hypothetical protein
LLLSLVLSLVSYRALGDNGKGVVKVVTEPSGASVYVDGRVYGPTPVLVELKPGDHSIVVSMDGYAPRVQKLNVLSGRVIRTKIVFSSKQSTSGIRVHELKKGGADAGPGTVTVTTEPPGLTVVVDGQTVSEKTPVAFDIHSGIYRLKIKQDGVVVAEKTIFVRAGRTSEFDFAIKRRRNIDDKDPWR